MLCDEGDLWWGLGQKENDLKPDEQRVAVIKHVLNTSITDCEPQLGVCCLALAACIESPQRGTFCVPTWFYIMIKLEWPLKSQIIFYLPFFSHLLLNVNEGKRFKSLQIKHFNWLKCNHNSKFATLYGKAFQYCWTTLVQSFHLSIDSEIRSKHFLCFQWQGVWGCFEGRFPRDWLWRSSAVLPLRYLHLSPLCSLSSTNQLQSVLTIVRVAKISTPAFQATCSFSSS